MIEFVKDYLISEDGKIWSNKTNKYISQRVGSKGYYIVNLSIDGKCKTFQVHRLVALTFIENPNNLPIINHKDGNKLNNSIENLEWCTYSDNTLHALKNNLFHPAKGKNTKFGRFSEEEIRKIRYLNKNGYSQRRLAKM